MIRIMLAIRMPLTLTFLLSLSACCRDDFASCSSRAANEFEKGIVVRIAQMKVPGALERIAIQPLISNACLKVRKRQKIGVNCKLAPVCCFIRDRKVNPASKRDGQRGFELEVEYLGEKVGWSNLDDFWLIVVVPSQASEGCCEVWESSLGNIVHGMGVCPSTDGYGTLYFRCNDPRLGWGNCEYEWPRKVFDGECKLYLVMDAGQAWGRRFGRSISETSLLEKRLARLDEKGVLIELVPKACSNVECLLECK